MRVFTMSKQRGKSKGLPKLGKFAPKGREPVGRVVIDGRAHYLGPWGSAECRENYNRVIAEWLSRDRKPAPPPPEQMLMATLCARYMAHAVAFYRKNGRETSEVDGVRAALRPLLELYSKCAVNEFDAPKLAAVRDSLIRDKIDEDTGKVIRRAMARTTINAHVMRIKRMIRWGVETGLVDAAILPGLMAVRGLAAGRTDARETDPKRPVPIEDVNAVRKLVSRQVKAMIDLQLFTGARPGEVCQMRPSDLKRDGEVWEFIPERHKGEHHGRSRIIMIGPKAQAVLEPFLENRPADSFCFSPAEAEQERLDALHAERVTPAGYGNSPGTNRKSKPEIEKGPCYETSSYRRAITRACQKAGIETWSPHRLRHTFATSARQAGGIEATSAALGHSALKQTEIYAQRDAALARKLALEIG